MGISVWIRILQSCKPNTLFINLPAAAIRALALKPGDFVKVSLGDSVILIEPTPLNRFQDTNKPQAQPNAQ